MVLFNIFEHLVAPKFELKMLDKRRDHAKVCFAHFFAKYALKLPVNRQEHYW